MEIDGLSPNIMTLSLFHVQLWRNSVILVSTAVRCLSFAWYIHNELPPDVQQEEHDGILDVDRCRLCWAHIPFQGYLSVVLKTRSNKFAFYASFIFICIRACVTVNIHKNRVLIFIHEIFIISILRIPWLVCQGCTEDSVYKVFRSSATFVEVMCSIPRCVLQTRL